LNPQCLLPAGSRPAALLPLGLAHAVAGQAGAMAWLASRRGRRTLSANTTAVGAGVAAGASCETFRTYARYYLSMMRLRHRSLAAGIGPYVWRDQEKLRASLRRGHGALVMSAHFGNWDLVGFAIAAAGTDVCVFVEPLAPRMLADFYRTVRARHAVRTVPVGDPGRMPIETLRGNGVLALAADRPFGTRREAIDIGTARLDIPVGGVRLALRHGAAIHGVFAVRTAAGFELRCTDDWAAQATALPDEAAQVRSVAAQFAAELQRLVQTHPGQWCLFAPLAPARHGAATLGRAA
jgi:lauroyl/myristoyl acyltransferase